MVHWVTYGTPALTGTDSRSFSPGILAPCGTKESPNYTYSRLIKMATILHPSLCAWPFSPILQFLQSRWAMECSRSDIVSVLSLVLKACMLLLPGPLGIGPGIEQGLDECQLNGTKLMELCPVSPEDETIWKMKPPPRNTLKKCLEESVLPWKPGNLHYSRDKKPVQRANNDFVYLMYIEYLLWVRYLVKSWGNRQKEVLVPI